MKKLSLMAILALGIAACGDTTQETKNTVEPEFGSGDSLRSVVQKGELEFGSAIESEFDEDIMFHGYRFNTVETAEFNLEITQRGTSRDLDTTLFLYGASNAGTWERIAYDDDSGWGAQSRLRGIAADKFVAFMAIVGTADGMGRGNYRLSLECTNDQCEGEPVIFETCTDDLCPIFEECVEVMLENTDWGWDDPAEEWSIEYCVEEGVYEEIHYYCELDSPEAYCQADVEAIAAVAPDCEERLENDYAIYDTIPLATLPLTEALQEQADLLVDYGNSYSWERLDGYQVATDVTTEQVAAAVRQENPRGNALSTRDVEDRDTFRERRYLPTEVLDVIETEYGTDYNATIISGSYYVAAGAEEWTTINVVHYPQTGVVFAITQVSGE